jgi:hypothetical protein
VKRFSSPDAGAHGVGFARGGVGVTICGGEGGHGEVMRDRENTMIESKLCGGRDEL